MHICIFQIITMDYHRRKSMSEPVQGVKLHLVRSEQVIRFSIFEAWVSLSLSLLLSLWFFEGAHWLKRKEQHVCYKFPQMPWKLWKWTRGSGVGQRDFRWFSQSWLSLPLSLSLSLCLSLSNKCRTACAVRSRLWSICLWSIIPFSTCLQTHIRQAQAEPEGRYLATYLLDLQGPTSTPSGTVRDRESVGAQQAVSVEGHRS